MLVLIMLWCNYNTARNKVTHYPQFKPLLRTRRGGGASPLTHTYNNILVQIHILLSQCTRNLSLGECGGGEGGWLRSILHTRGAVHVHTHTGTGSCTHTSISVSAGVRGTCTHTSENLSRCRGSGGCFFAANTHILKRGACVSTATATLNFFWQKAFGSIGWGTNFVFDSVHISRFPTKMH